MTHTQNIPAFPGQRGWGFPELLYFNIKPAASSVPLNPSLVSLEALVAPRDKQSPLAYYGFATLYIRTSRMGSCCGWLRCQGRSPGPSPCGGGRSMSSSTGAHPCEAPNSKRSTRCALLAPSTTARPLLKEDKLKKYRANPEAGSRGAWGRFQLVQRMEECCSRVLRGCATVFRQSPSEPHPGPQ